ncbi:LysR substrate-binding domain-containing protein [Bradyrhizobium sp. STM 3561]|uniref:LysR substrate-binding domain-containing protein n=1 Tax=Bradyrhizobium sp. STM 3561 TaxID=578923 RepID=UPI00388FEF0F
MVTDAAINGQGIALARTTLSAWDLINGRLVLPVPESLPLSKTYWVCPEATAALPKIATFREWLLAEAVADLRQLNTLAPDSGDRRPSRVPRPDGPRRRSPRQTSVGE